MNAMVRPLVVGCVVGFLAVCFFGLRFACSPMDFREATRSAELEELRQATFERLDARQEVVRDLIAQRSTLSQAIQEFRELDKQWPDYRPAAQEQAQRDPNERAFSYLCILIRDVLHDRPEQAALVVRRLEREYGQLQAPAISDEKGSPRNTLNRD